MNPAGTMRDPAIDVYRGLAITLVILGHASGLPEPLFKLVYSFHMPAFFLLSGFLFDAREAHHDPAACVEKRFFRLLVPAWVMGLVCGAPFLLFLALGKWGITPEVFLDKLVGTLTGYPGVAQTFLCTPLWFLFCLFFVELIAILVTRLFRGAVVPALASVGCVGMVAGSVREFVFPFDLHIAMSACFFFAVGMLARKSSGLRAHRWAAGAGALALWATLTALSPDTVNMARNFIGGGVWLPLNLAAALVGAYLLVPVARGIAAPGGHATAFFSFLGRHTLPVVGFNYWINVLVVEYLLGRGAGWPAVFLADLLLLLALLWVIAARGGTWGRLLRGCRLPARSPT